MMWRRKRVEPAAPVVELTAEEREAKHQALIASWRRRNPVNVYVITYRDGRSEEIVAHGYSRGSVYSDLQRSSSLVWTSFWAWRFEGFDGVCNQRVLLLECRTEDIANVLLKSPLPDTLSAHD